SRLPGLRARGEKDLTASAAVCGARSWGLLWHYWLPRTGRPIVREPKTKCRSTWRRTSRRLRGSWERCPFTP
ncbi:unnamed protein product, partial [Symbiodinium sp. CCMP2456]